MKYLNGESISAEDLILAAIPFNAEV
jgi:hypothetical protein